MPSTLLSDLRLTSAQPPAYLLWASARPPFDLRPTFSRRPFVRPLPQRPPFDLRSTSARPVPAAQLVVYPRLSTGSRTLTLSGTSGETVDLSLVGTANAKGVTLDTTAGTDTRAAPTLGASLLDSVGADMWTPCEVVLPCLLAADLLECAGGRASRIALVGGEAGLSIRAALAALARVDEDPTGYVQEGVRAARYALDRLRCWQHPAAADSPDRPTGLAHRHLQLLPPWTPSAGV